MSKTSDDSGKIWPWILLILGILVIIAVWGGVTIFAFPKLVGDVAVRGQWGDSFGMINALFAGLAFAGVIYAIILQKKELALQREELANTREEIRGQKEQLEAQNQTLQKQNFESSFFQLLSQHNDIVNSMAVQGSREKFSGRECFDYLFLVFRNNYAAYNYEEFFDQHQSYVGYYFRALYNFVKFVDQENDFLKDYGAKKFYTNLIRAQLSSDELGLLFYNCLSERGDKFKKLVEKYALLEDMDFEVLINEDHKNLYDKKAYGEAE